MCTSARMVRAVSYDFEVIVILYSVGAVALAHLLIPLTLLMEWYPSFVLLLTNLDFRQWRVTVMSSCFVHPLAEVSKTNALARSYHMLETSKCTAVRSIYDPQTRGSEPHVKFTVDAVH